jgi:hypothetical protein
MNTDERRKQIVHLTVKEFYGKPFAWGVRDCVSLAAYVGAAFGYPIDRAKFGLYWDALGSLRALHVHGINTTEELVDSIVGSANRIHGQEALPADIVALGFGARQVMLSGLCVAVGRGLVLGFAEDWVCRLLKPNWDIPGATYVGWRVQEQR